MKNKKIVLRVNDAGIQIYDYRYNQWISGRIGQSFIGYIFRYVIQFANRRLLMNHRAFSLTIDITDEFYLLAVDAYDYGSTRSSNQNGK